MITKNELNLIIQNPDLTKALLKVLSQDDNSFGAENPTLSNAVHGESTLFDGERAIVPAVSDLRDQGYQAPSKFVKKYVFPMSKKFQVWYQGHESGLRNAFYRAGLTVSMDTLMKGKKYQITITGTCAAKKKSA
jgi:hypothetical protein